MQTHGRKVSRLLMLLVYLEEEKKKKENCKKIKSAIPPHYSFSGGLVVSGFFSPLLTGSGNFSSHYLKIFFNALGNANGGED